ncbi:MAG: hypothetical protein ACRDCB_08820 [Clostridium sp.]
MKYYIVALLNEDSSELINPIQKSVSKRLKANRNLPVPHITLSVIENPNIDKLNPVIEKVLSPYKKFKVEVDNDIFISDEHKTINVLLHERGYIKKIKTNFDDMLKLHGFNIREVKDPRLSLTLANLNYYQKDTRRKSLDTTPLSESMNLNNSTFKISGFEVWKVPHNKREIKIKRYDLKTF